MGLESEQASMRGKRAFERVGVTLRDVSAAEFKMLSVQALQLWRINMAAARRVVTSNEDLFLGLQLKRTEGGVGMDESRGGDIRRMSRSVWKKSFRNVRFVWEVRTRTVGGYKVNSLVTG